MLPPSPVANVPARRSHINAGLACEGETGCGRRLHIHAAAPISRRGLQPVPPPLPDAHSRHPLADGVFVPAFPSRRLRESEKMTHIDCLFPGSPVEFPGGTRITAPRSSHNPYNLVTAGRISARGGWRAVARGFRCPGHGEEEAGFDPRPRPRADTPWRRKR
ncbi:hypothetical protein R5R35_011930 [Gryllus longicercus]|uniref:Uncharacterized protein n=1 Tax=Gryllus longicercus TaxID=2509291 RepID=A0AAN9W3L1_9ORTH